MYMYMYMYMYMCVCCKLMILKLRSFFLSIFVPTTAPPSLPAHHIYHFKWPSSAREAFEVSQKKGKGEFVKSRLHLLQTLLHTMCHLECKCCPSIIKSSSSGSKSNQPPSALTYSDGRSSRAEDGSSGQLGIKKKKKLNYFYIYFIYFLNRCN